MLRQTLQVFSYLKIRYPSGHHKNTLYYLPLFISILLSSSATWLMVNVEDGNYLSSDRFGDLFTLLAILPGFYIASLSAISAINRKAIDKEINSGNVPYIIKQEINRMETYQQKLTRRVYLTMLFAYLSAVSLILAIILIVIRFIFSFEITENFFHVPDIFSFPVLVFFLVNALIFFYIVQLFLLTLIGINYLGYKALVDE
ncbi:hypothetical protein [Psychrobacter sp.]|uniref:hypothetical protein n=1 Tax=Psychrobacter sp. TaxID=56811 RepID=UPI003C7241CA